jgi:organic radical activating enzyme
MNINLNEMFFSFQGESFNAGRRALFIRFPFCNLSCSWCDEDNTKHKQFSLNKIREFALSEKCRFAVITGGEPYINNEAVLVNDLLKELGFEIAVETNGTMEPKFYPDWITVSPKYESGFRIHESLENIACEFKYVVDDYFPWSVLDRHNAQSKAHLFLSPEYGDFHDNLTRIYSYIKTHPWWRISLQTHKWMGIR